MMAIVNCTKLFIYQIKKDMMLFAAMLAPLLAGMAFKFGIPLIENMIEKYFGYEQFIMPYYSLFDLLLIVLSSVMYSYIGAMCILEELDDGTARYLWVTPVGKRGYFFTRLAVPAISAFVITIIVVKFFALEIKDMKMILMLSFMALLQGIIIGLVVVALSHNKLEGMALTKLSGVFLLGIVVPYFMEGNFKVLFSILPGYWLSELYITGNIWNFVCGVAICMLWIVAFNKKIAKCKN